MHAPVAEAIANQLWIRYKPAMVATRHQLFATCPRDLEGLLADELTALGAADVRSTRAGVGFVGDLELAYRVCLWSRLASRILLPIREVEVSGPDALYESVHAIDWTAHLGVDRTFAVDVALTRRREVAPELHNTQFAALRVKDGIVDSMRRHWGTRPSVDRERPDTRVHVHLRGQHARVCIDLSGPSLHRRGYRKPGVQAAAPLKETIAAAMLIRADWPAFAERGAPLVDPMCGSGTLLIEAAWMAGDRAPGLLRLDPRGDDPGIGFGFLGWNGHDREVWTRLVEDARERARRGRDLINESNGRVRIFGMDRDPRAVSIANACIERAGLRGNVHVQRADLARLQLPRKGMHTGLVITNPPYGHRLTARGDLRQTSDKAALSAEEFSGLRELYRDLGARLLGQFSGWTAAVLTSDMELGLATELRASKRYALQNGTIPCKLLILPVVERPPRPTFDPHAVPGASDFLNRMRKNLKRLARWAKKSGVTCMRLYDADLPEFAVAIDLYATDAGKFLHVQEYQAPDSIDERKAERRRRAVLALLPEVVPGVAPERVVLKQRRRQRGSDQYQPASRPEGQMYVVREGPCRLLVNFDRYLDTGLFLDHRIIRGWIGECSRGQHVLNLFAYTSTASVHAAVGGAASTTSVDMSNAYGEWSRENFELNRQDSQRNRIITADCLAWLGERRSQRYGLIFLDPPTFSNSRKMDGFLDIQRDAVDLIRQTAKLLTPDGQLVFSCNRRGFRLDTDALAGLQAEDVTAASIPEDFSRTPHVHRCWRIRRER